MLLTHLLFTHFRTLWIVFLSNIIHLRMIKVEGGGQSECCSTPWGAAAGPHPVCFQQFARCLFHHKSFTFPIYNIWYLRGWQRVKTQCFVVLKPFSHPWPWDADWWSYQMRRALYSTWLGRWRSVNTHSPPLYSALFGQYDGFCWSMLLVRLAGLLGRCRWGRSYCWWQGWVIIQIIVIE